MFCMKCGSELVEGAVFCSKCGTKVANNEGNSVTTAQINTQSNIVEKERSTSDKIVLSVCGTIAALVGIMLMSESAIVGTVALAVGLGFFAIAFSKKYGKKIFAFLGVGVAVVFIITSISESASVSKSTSALISGHKSWSYSYEEDALDSRSKDEYKGTVTITETYADNMLEISYSGSDLVNRDASSEVSFSGNYLYYRETKDGIDYYSDSVSGTFGDCIWSISSDKKKLYCDFWDGFSYNTLIFTR